MDITELNDIICNVKICYVTLIVYLEFFICKVQKSIKTLIVASEIPYDLINADIVSGMVTLFIQCYELCKNLRVINNVCLYDGLYAHTKDKRNN